MLRRMIQGYIDQGYVRSERHPTLPLTIYNYTQKCTIDRAWDEITTRCRGLVLDDDGNVVASPLQKFFNFREPESRGLPWGEQKFDLEEKIDGTLIIAFRYGGEDVFATRGSFTSPQAEKAKELFENTPGDFFLPYGITYIFEVVYPEDQKVVPYGEKLFLLTRIDNETGAEDRSPSKFFDSPRRLEGLKSLSGEGIEREIAALENVEGFVVRFAGGERVKFKTPWYVERHRYIQKLSPKFIWEQLKEGKTKLMVRYVPEAQREWVTGIAREIANKWLYTMDQGLTAANRAFEASPLRKGQAKFIMKHYPEVSRIAFNFLDGKTEEAFESAWRKVKPCGEQSLTGKSSLRLGGRALTLRDS